MGIIQCNCENQNIEKTFVEMPTKYNERQIKMANIILESFRVIKSFNEFEKKEQQKFTQILEVINLESTKIPDIKGHISLFENIFLDSKNILTKCEVKKYDSIIFNPIDDKLEELKNEIKIFYMNKIVQDKELLGELNNFINSRIKHNELDDSPKENESIKLNFGNLMKFIDKAKKIDFIERSATFFKNRGLNKKVSFKISDEAATTKIEDEFNIMIDLKNADTNSLLIEYFLSHGENYPISLRNFISNIFSLRLTHNKFLTTTNNKFIPVNKKKIKSILTKGREVAIEKKYTFRKIKSDKEDDEKDREKEILPNNEKIDLRKNLNRNDTPKNYLSNSMVPQEKHLKSKESGEFNQMSEEEMVSNFTNTEFKKFQSKSNIINHKEKPKGKINLKALINSASMALRETSSLKNATQFYNGEICKNKHLYSGIGKLYKLNKKYIYFGTFKLGRKNGFGKLFKKVNDNEFFYYGGEYTQNKMEGYGHSLHYLKTGLKVTLTVREGMYSGNIFIKGEQIIIQEKENIEIIYEEYDGEFLNSQFSGKGKLKKKHLLFNKVNDHKYEAQYEYEYHGDFLDNLENGHGTAIKIFKPQNYSYRYEGEFSHGLMQGIGFIKYEGNYYIESYEGIFEKDKTFCRYGRVKFKSGDEYEGFFENGKKAEVGIYFYRDKKNKGENFFGRFADDNRDGIGRYNKPLENKVYVGKYVDGEKDGIFNLIYNMYSDNVSEKKGSFTSGKSGKSGKSSNLKSCFLPILQNDKKDASKHIIKSSKEIKTELIKQIKIYYLFENDEEIDKSDKPIRE